MKQSKILGFILGFILISYTSISQTNDLNDIQYGVAIKTTIDINGIESCGKYTNFNIAVIGGIGGHPFDLENIYPTIHGGFMMYNRGELISSYKKGFLESTVVDFLLDVTLNVGYYRDNINFGIRNVPLYHFSDFTPNPLQNPFQHSLSLGSNLIYSIDPYRVEQPQQVGFLNVMFDRHFQFNTYNDGTFFRKIGFADGLDRYYTGGGVFAYHLDNTANFDLLEFSFHKFTGHEKYAFDASNLLQVDFIPFKKPETFYYNKNRLRFTMANTRKNYGIHLTAHNTDRDFQDGIHFDDNASYHPDIFKNSAGIINELKRLGVGGYWMYTNLNFSN